MIAKVRLYERDGTSCGAEEKFLQVESHWNDDQRVELEIGGVRVVVVATDLMLAVQRCSR